MSQQGPGPGAQAPYREGEPATSTWPELAISLYDRLTGRGAEIVYEFEEMEVDVPSHVGADAQHARWRLDGTMRIRTEERGGGEGRRAD